MFAFCQLLYFWQNEAKKASFVGNDAWDMLISISSQHGNAESTKLYAGIDNPF